MRTASFFTYRGPGRVSVARWAPRATPAGFRVYRPLNPTADMLKLPRARYEPLYRAILARLDPRRVEADVARLAAPHEPVLLCWERPPFSDAVWCHRRMVAEWLEETLGLAVPEIAGEAAPSTDDDARAAPGIRAALAGGSTAAPERSDVPGQPS